MLVCWRKGGRWLWNAVLVVVIVVIVVVIVVVVVLCGSDIVLLAV